MAESRPNDIKVAQKVAQVALSEIILPNALVHK